MKKNVIIILIGIFTITILTFLPILPLDCYYDLVKSKLSILQVILSLITIIYLIIAFDRFGLFHSSKKKQFDLVYDLALNLKSKVYFFTSTTKITKGITYQISFRTDIADALKRDAEPFKLDSKKKIICNSRLFEENSQFFRNYSNNDYMPQKIKDKINEMFDYLFLSSIPEKHLDDFIEMTDHKKDSEPLIVNPEITFGEFVKNVQDLSLYIENWINKNSNIKFKIETPAPNSGV